MDPGRRVQPGPGLLVNLTFPFSSTHLYISANDKTGMRKEKIRAIIMLLIVPS
jgi:hypothetical protein